MEPRPPKRRKYSKGEPGKPFRIIQTISGPYKFSGRFNGFSVIIEKPSEMEKINSMGSFGKGNLSRHFPSFNKKEIEMLRQRQYNNRKKLLEKHAEACKNFEEKRLIVVDDSGSDNEDYMKNLKPSLQKLRVPVCETLNLCLEEAYFLMDAKECLKIKDFDENLLDSDMAWTLFSNTQETFIQNYVVYNFFRDRNWVVKSGLKFGGDFLLYKDGPAFYHASYVVIIDVIKSETGERLTEINKRHMDWVSLICLNRLAETASKELLICQVMWPQNLSIDEAKKSKKCLKDFTVKPILMKRWVSKSERKNYINPSTKKCTKFVEENNDIHIDKINKVKADEANLAKKNYEQNRTDQSEQDVFTKDNVKNEQISNLQDNIELKNICEIKDVKGDEEIPNIAVPKETEEFTNDLQKRKIDFSETEESKRKKT